MGNITNCLEKYGWIINLAFLGGYAAYIGVGGHSHPPQNRSPGRSSIVPGLARGWEY